MLSFAKETLRSPMEGAQFELQRPEHTSKQVVFSPDANSVLESGNGDVLVHGVVLGLVGCCCFNGGAIRLEFSFKIRLFQGLENT